MALGRRAFLKALGMVPLVAPLVRPGATRAAPIVCEVPELTFSVTEDVAAKLAAGTGGRSPLAIDSIATVMFDETEQSLVLGNLVDKKWDSRVDSAGMGGTIRIKRPIYLSTETL